MKECYYVALWWAIYFWTKTK